MSTFIIILIGLSCFILGFYTHIGIVYMNKREEVNNFIERMEQESQEQEQIKVKLEDGWRMWKIDEENGNVRQMTEEEEQIEIENYPKANQCYENINEPDKDL